MQTPSNPNYKNIVAAVTRSSSEEEVNKIVQLHVCVTSRGPVASLLIHDAWRSGENVTVELPLFDLVQALAYAGLNPLS